MSKLYLYYSFIGCAKLGREASMTSNFALIKLFLYLQDHNIKVSGIKSISSIKDYANTIKELDEEYYG